MSDTTSMDMSLNESSDGVDMTRPATVLSRERVYQGAIFGVEDMRIALQTRRRRTNRDPQTGDAARALCGHAGA